MNDKGFLKQNPDTYVYFASTMAIPFLRGRPRRDSAINYDDIMNLKILLNIHADVGEFLKNLD